MPIREWFDALAPREKLLVAAAALLLVVAIVILGAVRPLAVGQKRASEQLADKRAVLADIERVAARLGPQTGAGNAAKPSSESLVVLVDRTTRSHGLAPYLKRNEPDGAASIRLRFENAPFDELMAWLVEMQVAQSIGVVNATADPAKDPGRVSANLQMSRTAAR